MKFDVRTLEILKNFYTINPSIKFTQGKVLKTVTPLSKSILAKAYIKDEIEKDFCIGELNRFMSALSIFPDPELVIGDKSMIIKGDNNQIEYGYIPEKLIKVAPDREIVLPSLDVQFTLTNDMFQTLRKAMSILSVTEMGVIGDGQTISLEAKNYDPKALIKDTYKIDIGKTDKNFNLVFKGENLKLLPLDYEVSISSKGISWFKNPEVEYWIVIEAGTSNFE